MNLFSIFRRKPRPISYMDRPDVQSALAQQAKARSRHAKGANAVYELTHRLLREELGKC